MRLFLFLIPGIIFIAAASWLIYLSIVKCFSVQTMSGKIIIAVILIAIIFGFFAVSAISRVYESSLVKYLYFAFAVMIGVMVFAFFASVIGWIIIWAAKLLGISVTPHIVMIVMMSLALVFSGYNIWNAYNLKVTNIDVSIKNLPQQWKGKTIVQISDVHLGNVLGVTFLNKIVNMANAQNPDIIVITGDLFDGMDGNLEPYIGPLNRLRAPGGIFYVSGNHELYLGLDKALAITNKTKIRFIDNKIINDDGLQIIGIGYGQDLMAQDIKKIITSNPNYDASMPSVLLYHIPLPSQIEVAKEMGIGLYLAGHTHVGQMFPFDFITHIVYKGYDYGIHREGDFTEYTSSGAGTWGPPMRSGNTPEIVAIHLQ